MTLLGKNPAIAGRGEVATRPLDDGNQQTRLPPDLPETQLSRDVSIDFGVKSHCFITFDLLVGCSCCNLCTTSVHVLSARCAVLTTGVVCLAGRWSCEVTQARHGANGRVSAAAAMGVAGAQAADSRRGSAKPCGACSSVE